jgi:hypothetical protein
MSDNSENNEIKVEEQPDLGLDEIKIEEEGVEKPVSNEDELAKLRAEIEAERNARLEAERRAQEAQIVAHRASSEVDDTNLQLVTSAIDTVKRENDILKANYRAAMSNADYEKAAEYQEAMSHNAAKLLQLENGKTAMENKPRNEPPVQRSSDPVEQLASQLSPRSADWVRRHPQYATDPRLTQKMIAAHNLAVADGHRADTDDYFQAVEETLKINRKVEQNESALSSAAEPARRREAPPAAAPVSRDTARSNTVRLSAEEREMASMMKMTPEEYARNKLALKREGKMH